MPSRTNDFGQPLGAPLDGWTPPAPLDATAMDGRYCRLEPLADHHMAPLFEALAEDGTQAIWTYLPIGPFHSAAEFSGFMEMALARGWQPFAILDRTSDRTLGSASYMRIDAANGSAEIGAVIFSPAMQRSRLGTEAISLMMGHMFAAGYRRSEWKCNALNEASRQAALRLGFSFEGVLRQFMVVKGRNRDTAWYSCLDTEWPTVKAAHTAWLSPENFDAAGRQTQSLSDMTRPLLHWPDLGPDSGPDLKPDIA